MFNNKTVKQVMTILTTHMFL